MLEGLTEAREDDEIVDFSPCIKAADRGRLEALSILHAFMLRRMKEEEEVASTPIVRSGTGLGLSPPIQLPQQPRLHVTTHPTRQPTQPILVRAETLPLSPALTAKKSRFPIPFRRDSANTVGSSQTQNISPRGAGPDVLQSDRYTSPHGHRGSSTRPSSHIQQESNSSIDSRNLSSSPPTVSVNSSPNTTNSRRTSFSGSSTFSPIVLYGGCCKYAHQLRDGKAEKALTLQYSALENSQYQCSSVKCSFQVPAIRNQKREWLMDDRIRSSHGLQYRWIFLVKSHMYQQGNRSQYRCIICVLLGDQSSAFTGQDALFTHVISHQGALLNSVRLEGPLSFSNNGVRVDGDFDINLPESASPSSSSPLRSENTPVTTEVQKETDQLDNASHRSAMSYQEELEFNQWAR